MVNIDLKLSLIRTFGSQLAASRKLRIHESKLSHIVRGYDEPNEREREILKRALGRDFFSKEDEGPRAA
jgi:hypothetical protein